MSGCKTVGMDDMILIGTGIGGVREKEKVVAQGLKG